MKYLATCLALILLAASITLAGHFAHAQSTTQPDEQGFIPFVASENPLGWNIPYVFMSDPADPAYAIALKQMMPTYKGNLGYNSRPLIGLAQVNLNRDPDVEIIAFPTEEDEETGLFCTLNSLCPHYVLEIQGNKVNTLGVLYGWKVNRGDRILNGYYTLKVYSLPSSENSFEEYAFNPRTNEYTPVPR